MASRVNSPRGPAREVLRQVLSGRADANIDFDNLCDCSGISGFEERTRGSHHIFRQEGVEEMINSSERGARQRIYQVRQVRAVLLKYRLGKADQGEER